MPDPRIRRLVLAILAMDGGLVAAYLLHIGTGERSWLMRALFDLNAEGTIAAWFTSAQLLLAGASFLYVAGSGPSQRVASWFFAVIGAGFCFLSMDEVVGIHEKIGTVFGAVEALPRFSGDHGVWIPIYIAAAGALVGVTARQWIALGRSHRLGTAWLVGGACVFVLGAVALEIVGYGSLREIENRRLYTLLVAAEEGMEILGATAMLLGSLTIAATPHAAAGPATDERTTQPSASSSMH